MSLHNRNESSQIYGFGFIENQSNGIQRPYTAKRGSLAAKRLNMKSSHSREKIHSLDMQQPQSMTVVSIHSNTNPD